MHDLQDENSACCHRNCCSSSCHASTSLNLKHREVGEASPVFFNSDAAGLRFSPFKNTAQRQATRTTLLFWMRLTTLRSSSLVETSPDPGTARADVDDVRDFEKCPRDGYSVVTRGMRSFTKTSWPIQRSLPLRPF